MRTSVRSIPWRASAGDSGCAEFRRNIGQEGGGRHLREHEVGDRTAAFAKFVVQARGDRRLAGADSAAQGRRAQAVIDHVPQLETCRQMRLAVEEKGGEKCPSNGRQSRFQYCSYIAMTIL